MTDRLHTYIKCKQCGFGVRAFRHTPVECKANQNMLLPLQAKLDAKKKFFGDDDDN